MSLWLRVLVMVMVGTFSSPTPVQLHTMTVTAAWIAFVF